MELQNLKKLAQLKADHERVRQVSAHIKQDT